MGFEGKAEGGKEQPAVVLNQLMQMTRAAGRPQHVVEVDGLAAKGAHLCHALLVEVGNC